MGVRRINEDVPDEPASYSPTAAIEDACALYEAIVGYKGTDQRLVRNLAELCHVITALASMCGCPANMSVEDYRWRQTLGLGRVQAQTDATG